MYKSQVCLSKVRLNVWTFPRIQNIVLFICQRHTVVVDWISLFGWSGLPVCSSTYVKYPGPEEKWKCTMQEILQQVWIRLRLKKGTGLGERISLCCMVMLLSPEESMPSVPPLSTACWIWLSISCISLMRPWNLTVVVVFCKRRGSNSCEMELCDLK